MNHDTEIVRMECQRIPLAFRTVLPLMNLEIANDNHHSYIIKVSFWGQDVGADVGKLLIKKSGRRGSNPRRPAWEDGRRLNLKINRASRRLLSASKPL